MAQEGICGFGDCIAQMIGFALIGVAVGVGGSYLLAQQRQSGRRALPMPEEEAATAGLSGRRRGKRRSRRRALGGGCGCGG